MDFSNWFSNAGSSPRSVIDGPENERGLEAVPVVVNDPDAWTREIFQEAERRRAAEAQREEEEQLASLGLDGLDLTPRTPRGLFTHARTPPLVRQQAHRPRAQRTFAEMGPQVERPASLGAAAAVGREKLYINEAITGKRFSLVYDKDDRIGDVKQKISDNTGYEKDTLRLFFPPHILNDDSQTLDSYGITKDQTIQLIRNNPNHGGFSIKKKRPRKRKTKKRRKKKTKKRRKNRKKKTKKRKLKHRKKTRKRR